MKCFSVIVALLALAVVPARAADPTPSATELDASIKKGVEWLYEQQKDGNWEQSAARKPGEAFDDDITGGQWGGQTALCVYALLMAGEKPTDPRLKQAVDFLRTADIKGVYALGVRCQVWLNLPEKDENRVSMRRDALALMGSVQQDAKKRKGHQVATWDYLLGGDSYSLSRTQYAILALWAAAQLKVEIPATFWAQVEKTWIAAQTAEGGWTYKHPDDTDYPATVGMTAAGLATLFIAEDFTVASKVANANGNAPANPAVTKALQWIVKHWDDEVGTDEKQTRVYPFSALYAVERVGLASGLRSLGPIDWYGRGAAWLVGKQRKDGAFSASTARGARKGVVDTCFAVLFLARGRVPVAFNKLDYSNGVADTKAAAWNQRPRDIAHLTRWTTLQLEREFRWQIVTLADDDAALAESPILYLAGTKDVEFTDEAKKKIKRFIDAGGVLLASADGPGKAFTDAVQKMLAELYPLYGFRELPASHPLYTAQVYQREKWKIKPQIIGMSNGVRELALVVPAADWGRWWQTQRVDGKEDGWQFGLDLVTYMNDKTAYRSRGARLAITPDPAAKPNKIVRVARIRYNGNWDPEPQAWPQMTAWLANKGVARIETQTVKLGDALDGFVIAHLTGTTAIALDGNAKAALKKFLDGGGTLLVDAAGGAREFGASLEAQLPMILAAGTFKNLPLSHKLFATDVNPLKAVAVRDFANRGTGAGSADTRLQTIEIAGRPAVIFSKLDLTAGLVGFTIDGIPGWAPASAREIVGKIVEAAAS